MFITVEQLTAILERMSEGYYKDAQWDYRESSSNRKHAKAELCQELADELKELLK